MATAGKGSKAKGGALRFAPTAPPEGTHVHFEDKLHDSPVMVPREKDGSFLVKVGFLKILHKYEITFLLPLEQSPGRDLCALPVPNPNLRVLAITSLPEGHSVRCEYTAHREGVLKEELVLVGHGQGQGHGHGQMHGHGIKVTVQARVM
ncbi:PREDICTED: UPF0687 protein C20orf27 homolog, partial [Acanthisitta chloris]|uniref:UPF0687 protein C20orf27 homolog n=1 Tax=Acanthisitta chloris TaxID=57068 RepID=UPI0004F0E7E2